MKDRMRYAVVEIQTGELLYAGPKAWMAVDALVPGTTYGSDPQSLEAAVDQASKRAAKHRYGGYTQWQT